MNRNVSNNITDHNYLISRKERWDLNQHRSFLIFFTGLSGSGKSTLANALEYKLFQENVRTYVLDGDNIRRGINSNLGFTPADRSENLRRIAEISKLFIDAGLVVLSAFIAPYEKDREFIKETVGSENYVEVFVNTSLEECERRDPKGLYKKARAGEISNMTGITAPYEKPVNPDVVVTEAHGVDEAASLIYNAVKLKLKSF